MSLEHRLHVKIHQNLTLNMWPIRTERYRRNLILPMNRSRTRPVSLMASVPHALVSPDINRQLRTSFIQRQLGALFTRERLHVAFTTTTASHEAARSGRSTVTS